MSALKNQMVVIFYICSILFAVFPLQAQDTIKIKNGSFEAEPKQGMYKDERFLPEWTDCGKFNQFFGESPPDIHPNGYWNVETKAIDGQTYLGMVTRDNDTYESVSQKLSSPLYSGNCYTLSLFLARSDLYWSISKLTGDDINFNIPLVVLVWGSKNVCEETELLFQSNVINHESWEQYKLNFRPKNDISFITISAFYDIKYYTRFRAYCGNVLIDGISDITEITCENRTNQHSDR